MNRKQVEKDFGTGTYNIEDTATLLTGSSGKGKRRALILAVAAIVAVVAIGIVGFSLISSKHYDDQVAVAEKSLQEGKYEQAEADYLKAVSMKPRKAEAKKGLAITYALEGKFEESGKTYIELYESTEEESYKEAAEIVEEGLIPFNKDALPDNNVWIALSVDEVPYYSQLEQFLGSFATYYLLWVRPSDPECDNLEYQYYNRDESGNSFYALLITPFLIEEGYVEGLEGAVEHPEYEDPRGWSEGLYYSLIKKEIMDEAVALLFNVDREKIDEMVSSAEERRKLYSDGEYYYYFTHIGEYTLLKASITDVRMRAGKLLVQYDIVVVPFDEGPFGSVEEETIGTYYAELELGSYDDQPIWTMISNGPEIPEGVPDD